MSDRAHKETDQQLAALERRIARVYREASEDMREKIAEYFASFEKRDKEQQELLKAGKITENQYKMWRLNQIGRGKRFEALRDQLAERYTKANETAVAYINDATPGVYSLNRNYTAYTIERVADDADFTLWDAQTAKRLIKDRPGLMPYYPKRKAVRRGIDLRYGKRVITSQVTSGILQGESIGKIANRLQKYLPEMERSSAIRTARTSVTGAQNAGRQDSYKAAEKMGLVIQREWVATLDSRTRHEHAKLDGQVVGVDEPFRVGGEKLMFPGDPDGPPHLVYNCRCTVVARVKGASGGTRLTYDQWRKRKEAGGSEN